MGYYKADQVVSASGPSKEPPKEPSPPGSDGTGGYPASSTWIRPTKLIAQIQAAMRGSPKPRNKQVLLQPGWVAALDVTGKAIYRQEKGEPKRLYRKYELKGNYWSTPDLSKPVKNEDGTQEETVDKPCRFFSSPVVEVVHDLFGKQNTRSFVHNGQIIRMPANTRLVSGRRLVELPL